MITESFTESQRQYSFQVDLQDKQDLTSRKDGRMFSRSRELQGNMQAFNGSQEKQLGEVAYRKGEMRGAMK